MAFAVPTGPKITLLEFRSRSSRTTPDTGEIIRKIYVEPYQAYTTVEEALLGSVDPDIWTPKRRKPCQDPFREHYYCAEVSTSQLDERAMAVSPSTEFELKSDDEIQAVIDALQTKENPTGAFCYANPDPAGGGDDTPTPSAGANLWATYRPLVILDGLMEEDDEFDYVDPLLVPISRTQVVGRDMNYLPKFLGVVDPLATSDVATIQEVIWSFTIRRLMVPNYPKETVNKLTNKVNEKMFSIGNLDFPPETLRFESCDISNKRSPDGTTWHDLMLHFSWRTLFDERYNIDSDSMTADYVGWNRQLGTPKKWLGALVAPMGYYPVGWTSSVFKLIADYRYEFLHDSSVNNSAGKPATFKDLFDLKAR